MPRSGVARISRLATSIVLIAFGVTQMAPVEVNAAGESWFNDSWQFRKAITIDATKVSSGPHTDFPVLVNLTSDTGLAASAQADGDDILFTSSGGVTQLSHEIEKYGSSTGALVAWVKVPSLPSSTDTVFFMYYGNGSATSQQDATNVWDTNYKGVWHLKEDPAVAGASGIIDSTSNNNHGTDNGSMTADDQVAGQIDGSLDFDGTDDFVSVADANSLDITSQLTISLWLRADTFPSSGAYDNLLIKGNSTAQNYYLETFNNAGTNRIAFGFVNSGGVFQELIGITTALSTSTWYHVVATFVDNGTTNDIKLYINATQQNESVTSGAPEGSNNLVANANTLRIGFTTTNEEFDGRIDEPRISKAVRSGDWITTEYNNQNSPSTFYSVGTATVQQPTVTTGSATNVTTSSATLNGTVNAHGTSTTALFQYGENSTIYTGTSSTTSISTDGTTTVSIGISGLSASTTYYYRIAANNSAGTSTGSEASFTTSTSAPPPEPLPGVTLTINSTSPSDGATDVAIDTTVSATFSMYVDGSTLTTDTFKLNDGDNEVAGSVTTNGATATFTPSANLDYNTTYTARVTTGARAANYAGTTLNNDYTWSFTTTEDADPPTVRSTSPVSGTAGVAINSSIIATFSETIDASTITTDTFTVSDGSGNIGGTVSYSDKTATFTPSSNLSDSTIYTARITTGVMDLAGNAMASDYTWSFTTVETTPPTVISTIPVNGAAGVAINSTIAATFSEAMQSSTINTNTFMVSNGSGNISGTLSYSGTTTTFTPSSNLSSYTTYTATITTGVMDLAGNTLASDYTWSFTTVDTTLPTVSSTSPANGATGVAINSTITATFSEAMQSSTMNSNTFTVSNSSGAISGTVSYSGTTATFTPSGNLSDSTTYTATITTRVKDLAANAMASDYTWSFTTVDTTQPIVSSTIPVNGAAGVAINSTITATFSEAMQSSTINTNTFTVSDGIRNISGTLSYRGTTATFTLSSNLSDSTTYTATITTAVKDLAGNAMASTTPGALRRGILLRQRSVPRVLSVELLAWQLTVPSPPRSTM